MIQSCYWWVKKGAGATAYGWTEGIIDMGYGENMYFNVD